MSRVKIAMPNNASVVLSGNDLSMSEVVELLAETLKEGGKPPTSTSGKRSFR